MTQRLSPVESSGGSHSPIMGLVTAKWQSWRELGQSALAVVLRLLGLPHLPLFLCALRACGNEPLITEPKTKLIQCSLDKQQFGVLFCYILFSKLSKLDHSFIFNASAKKPSSLHGLNFLPHLVHHPCENLWDTIHTEHGQKVQWRKNRTIRTTSSTVEVSEASCREVSEELWSFWSETDMESNERDASCTLHFGAFSKQSQSHENCLGATSLCANVIYTPLCKLIKWHTTHNNQLCGRFGHGIEVESISKCAKALYASS